MFMAVHGVGFRSAMECGENVGGSSQPGRIVTTHHGGDGWCLSARDLENIHGGAWRGVLFCYGVW